MVDRLAKAQPGPVPLIVVSDTLGGRGLDYWADNGELRRLIAEVPWNVVVLQERSVTPSLPASDRVHDMDPRCAAWPARSAPAGHRRCCS